jgi:hypothetical protein
MHIHIYVYTFMYIRMSVVVERCVDFGCTECMSLSSKKYVNNTWDLQTDCYDLGDGHDGKVSKMSAFLI